MDEEEDGDLDSSSKDNFHQVMQDIYRNNNFTRTESNTRTRHTKRPPSAPRSTSQPRGTVIKRKRFKATVVPSSERFFFIPGNDLVPLKTLPAPLLYRFSSWLDGLLGNDKYRDQAWRKLVPENQNKVVNSGVCIAKHIIWKSRYPKARPSDVACKTCCEASDPRTRAKLAKNRSELRQAHIGLLPFA
jgi:hypothetical protein